MHTMKIYYLDTEMPQNNDKKHHKKTPLIAGFPICFRPSYSAIMLTNLRFFGPLMSNCTLPAESANRV